MGSKIKFHAIAITLICSVVTVLYVFIGPKTAKQQPEQTTNGRTVTISGATWGENCNAYMAQSIEDQNASPVEKDAKGYPVAKPIPRRVTPDNVLKPVGEACDGKPVCELYVDASTLGVDPLPTCFKRLNVTYRCFSFDRLNTLDVGQGETLKIDCTQTAAPHAPAKQ